MNITSDREDGSICLAVLIATCDRPDLLARRALTSLQRQTSPPDYLVVVDDSKPKTRPDNRNIVNDLRLGGVRIIYLNNTRHRGACGAWNTGLEWLRRHAGAPNKVFVAILDDDDEWEVEHLAVCKKAVAKQQLDMVAPAIRRITDNALERVQIPPPTLDPGPFLVGNPHIQGSNLFVRLDAMLEAGGFDESLTSSTDRDICIRLADLGWVRYARIEQPTVRHHAEVNRLRLSSPGGERKQRGLDRFWSKWHGRMTDQEREACLGRAKEFFGWEPTAATVPALSPVGPFLPVRIPTSSERAHADDIVLVAGVITDSGHTKQFCRLLDQLLALQCFDQVCCLDVVVLQNGGAPGVIEDIVSPYRGRGLAIFLASEEQQIEDAKQGVFGDGFERKQGRAPIGPARTMLQTYVTRVMKHRPGAIAWILDDDSSLNNLCDQQATVPFENLLTSLKQMQSMGADVILGSVTGDPPVPPGSSVRTQLVDLYHNLAWMRQLDPDSELPDRTQENQAARGAAKDYYYDLSRRDTHHLEWPFWMVPARPGERAGDALTRMVDSLPRILAGQSLFRPLVLDPAHDAVASMRPSVQRGSNTFVFECDAFTDFPNASPTFAGTILRRSDMIWSLLNRYAGGRRIIGANLPVRHDRSDEKEVGLDWDRLLPDIRGYALYSSLEEVLVRRRERRLREGIGAEQPDDLQFTKSDLDFAVGRYRKFLTERTAALLWNCWRIQGVCKAIARLCDESRDAESAKHRLPERGAILDFLERACACFALDRLERIAADVMAVPNEEVRSFLRDLNKIVARHRKAALPLPQEDDWFHRERNAAALALAQTAAGAGELRLLGAGGEGIVFASPTTVFKVIDYSKRSSANGAWHGLSQLAASSTPVAALYRPNPIEIAKGRTILSYPFEPSEPYRGGHADGILRLLRDCRSAGIVTTNLHPKNLRVTASGLLLIDYGSDIRPFSKGAFESMVQRAWLTIRYHDRADLSNLMRQALNKCPLPELEGWETLLAAVDPPSKREIIDEALIDILRPWKPHKVLDFGCGHGHLAVALASEGADVTAFDPDSTLRTRWQKHCMNNASSIRWLSGRPEDALAGLAAQFDTVVCSLVLCVIESEPAYALALRTISSALRHEGRFLIVVCNPGETLAGDSTLQRRSVPEDANASNVFTWVKQLPSGNRRCDVHRPLGRIIDDLAKFGMQADRITTTGGISLNRLSPSLDYLIIEGRKSGRSRRIESRRASHCCGSGPRLPESIPVLCYHRVLPEGWNDEVSAIQRRRGTVVDLNVFKQQLVTIQRHLHPVTLPEYNAWLDGQATLPSNSCLLTFDDAYRDFADVTLPVLNSCRIPCVLFATMSAARGERLLPVDLLYSALSVAERNSSLGPDKILDWLTGQNKRRYIHASLDEQFQILEEAGLHPAPLSPSELYLTENELASLPVELVTLGGHGCCHELLADKLLPMLRAELRRVRFWLEQLNHRRECSTPTFAYPNGTFDSLTIAATIEAGYSAAFTVKPWGKGRANHRWCLNRSCVPNDPDAITDLLAGKEVRI
jgi:2-polyprenyl-3-methyl-5-hydroxy-6-metoxy-1,4-benzoquinol methylase/peptidoglycan/xylan/chitin deacetylase (PgdA/CDA1 family)/glycosyltransferase involved in cell wall biosynthesis